MKKLNRHKILSAACIAALPLLVVACLEFDGIIQPGRALTDSEIEVTAQLRVSPGEDGSGKVVFAVLAPKAWNLRDNATLYLTTKDYNAIQNQPEVVNEQLTLMPAEEKDPKNGLSWADSFMSVIGRGGNDPQTAMEWVVWRSSTTFIFDDKIEVDGQEVETADVHADVRIRMKTGAVPLTCELGTRIATTRSASNATNSVSPRHSSPSKPTTRCLPPRPRYSATATSSASPSRTEARH